MRSLTEGKKSELPQARHTRSHLLQEYDHVAGAANAKVWATNQLFSPAEPEIHAPPLSPVLRGKIRRMGSQFDYGDAVNEVCRNAGRCRPQGIFSGFFAEFFTCVVPRSSSEPSIKKTSTTRATTSSKSELLDLSKRQQSALIDKQDAIDLLEWKLRKLKAIDDSSSESSSGTSSTSDPSSSCRSSRLEEPSLLADLCRNTKTRFSEVDSWKVDGGAGLLSDKVPLFEIAATRARVAVKYYCKMFMKQMEFSGYSVFRTLSAIDPSAKFMKREHTSFLLEANINKALYHCFENDSFDDTGLTLIIDPKERSSVRFEEFQRFGLVDSVDAANTIHSNFEPKFLAFCEQKMREIWFLFPWNIVFKDTEERKHFTGAFLDAAKCIWLLHRLASSLCPAAAILRVGKGMEINAQYVEGMAMAESTTTESFESAVSVCPKCKTAKVQFMIAPGFQVHQSVIKCQVYEHLLCD